MLSLFPILLSYQQLSPFLIRLTLGAILVYWSYSGLKEKKSSGAKKTLDAAEAVIGILIIIGLWTQAAALVAAIGFIVCLVKKAQARTFLTSGVNYLLILLVLSISLMVTGAGWWAFDLPL